MNKILLETVNLKKTYDHKNGTINLFDKVNIKIKQGDLIALVGPSGSGKSSFLHLLALLDDPTKGKIILENNNTNDLIEEKKDLLRRQKISIIFQEPMSSLSPIHKISQQMTDGLIYNGESWQDAYVEPSSDRGLWRRWSFKWDVHEKGNYVIKARATDEEGRTQPQTPWNFQMKHFDGIVPVDVEVV